VSCSDPAPDKGGDDGGPSSVLDGLSGTGSKGLAITIPDGALTDPSVKLTVEEFALIPRGAVRAWVLNPDGTEFAKPVVLEADYGDFHLPPGVDADSLRLSVFVDERWVPLADSANDVDKKVVRATTTHFSIYGLVPDPKEVDGRGMLWDANGVSLTTNVEHFARLSVSPTAISVFLSGEQSGSVEVGLSGLPTQGTHHLYVDSLGGHRLVTPADGGQVVLTLDRARPHYVWIQPSPGTVHIGGGGDQCVTVGAWAGNVCTLTTDIVGGVSIEAPDVVLDCAGHRIAQEYGDRRMGVGVLVTETREFGFPSDVTIQNCTIGGTDQEFWEGVRVFNGASVRLLGSELEYNRLEVISGTGLEVAWNTFSSLGGVAVAINEDATGGEVHHNVIEAQPGDEVRGIELYGMVGESGPLPVSEMSIHNNTITATVGIFMKRTSDGLLVGNDITAWTGFEMETVVGVNRYWWNNIQAQVGVIADEAMEISDGEGRGNWWGNYCPGPLFVGEVNSNRVDVIDNFAYGKRNAWELGLEAGCDTRAPDAPLIQSPEEGSTLLTTPVLVGTAEPGVLVTAFEETHVVGSTYATDTGRFALVSEEPWLIGSHAVYITATDSAGNESIPSGERTFTIDPPSDGNSLVSDNGKASIIEITNQPNPFDPDVESNKLRLVLEVDGVKGLGGASENHQYFAVTKRTVLAPDTLEPIATLFGVAEIPQSTGNGQSAVRVEVTDEWNGRDTNGNYVLDATPFPQELLVNVVRFYVGNGQGPPCSRQYNMLPADVLAMFGMFQFAGKQACDCATLRFADPERPTLSQIVIQRPVVWTTDLCADNCQRASDACADTPLNDIIVAGKTRCLLCKLECDTQCKQPMLDRPYCDWPLVLLGTLDTCEYWDYSTAENPYVLEACFPRRKKRDPEVHKAYNCREAQEACRLTTLANTIEPDGGQCDVCFENCVDKCKTTATCKWYNNETRTTGTVAACGYWDSPYYLKSDTTNFSARAPAPLSIFEF